MVAGFRRLMRGHKPAAFEQAVELGDIFGPIANSRDGAEKSAAPCTKARLGSTTTLKRAFSRSTAGRAITPPRRRPRNDWSNCGKTMATSFVSACITGSPGKNSKAGEARRQERRRSSWDQDAEAGDVRPARAGYATWVSLPCRSCFPRLPQASCQLRSLLNWKASQ